MQPNSFTFLTPPLPAALALLRVRSDRLRKLVDRDLPKPNEPPRFARFGEIDEGLIVAEGDQTWLLTPHGGAGVADALRLALSKLGLTELASPRLDQAFAAGMNAYQQHALELLPFARSDAGRALLLEAINLPAELTSTQPDSSAWPAVRPRLMPPRVVLVGDPNAGKSTLFNALAAEAEAIVSNIAGTTRDALHAELAFDDGTLVDLFDTPGIREATASDAERVGMSIGLRLASQADLIVLLIAADSESARDIAEAEAKLRAVLAQAGSNAEDTKILTLISKADLQSREIPVGLTSIASNDSASLAALKHAIHAALFSPLPDARPLPLTQA